MDLSTVAAVINGSSFQSSPNNKAIKKLLRKFINDILDIGSNIDIDVSTVLETYIESKSNQLDRRQPRSINLQDDHYRTNEEKQEIIDRNRAIEKFNYEEANRQTTVTGYDPNIKDRRVVNLESEYLLAIVAQPVLLEISDKIPSVVKYKSLKISDLYMLDMPPILVDQFPDTFSFIAPKKKTVMIGIDGYSSLIKDLEFYPMGSFIVQFIDADTAERIDDEYPYKYWFFENYNPKRKYQLIYSNSRKSINKPPCSG